MTDRYVSVSVYTDDDERFIRATDVFARAAARLTLDGAHAILSTGVVDEDDEAER